MPSERPPDLRFLLDEHYPGWLADDLASDGLDVVSLTAGRPELRGADDTTVLRAAVTERRVVVTEDVSTFGVAASHVPEHVGIIYCHYSRFPRTKAGLHVLRHALIALSKEPPNGLGEQPIVWWMTPIPAGVDSAAERDNAAERLCVSAR